MKRLANVRPTVFMVVLALAAVLGAVPALAQLEGDTISCATGFPPGSLFFTPGTSAVVGAGVEFTLEQPSAPLFTFNFAGNSLTVTSVFGSGNIISQSSPIIFSSIDWPADPSAYIAGVYVSQSSGIIGAGNVTFTGHTLTVNLCCGIWRPGDSATIDLYPESGLIPAETQSWGAIKAYYR